MSEDSFRETGTDLSLSELKKQRGTVKGRLTLFEKYVSKYESVKLSERQQAELGLRIDSVSGLLKCFNLIQDRIDQLLDEDELHKQLEYRESFEDQYFSIMSAAKCLIEDVRVQTRGEPNSQCSHLQQSNKSILPDIKLPSFDGSVDQWLEFKNSYLSLVHKRANLDAIQKFHYLKSALSGPPLELISAIDFTVANYSHAWELLEGRYHNNRILIHNHVKAIFTAQPITNECSAQIRKLIDVILRNLRSLKSLDEPTDHWDTLIIYIIVSKLDSPSEVAWENYKGPISSDLQREKTKLSDLLNFLRNRADMLDVIENNHSEPVYQHQRSKNTSKNRKPTYTAQKTHSFVSSRNNDNTNKSRLLCAMCNENHALYACYKFLNLTVPARIKFIDTKHICRNCLRAEHSIADCLFGPCKQCQRKHNTLLHNDNYLSAHNPSSPVVASAQRSQSADNKPVSIVSCAMRSVDHANVLQSNNTSSSQLSQVLLSTALIEVMDSNKTYHTARALLDSGSQNSFITEAFCKRLKVITIQPAIRISGVGQSVSSSNRFCDINMRSKTCNFNTQLRCFVLPCITASLPSTYVDSEALSVPSQLHLADPSFNEPSTIDVLVGADIFWDLLDNDRIRLSKGPYLQNSKLGWLVSGPLSMNSSLNKNINCNFVQTSNNIDTQLRQFWELEEIGETNSLLTEDERICEDSFVRTTIRDSSGRFSVRIPLKESADSLGDSFELAKSRFLSLERKLDRSPTYKRMYCDFMREYADLGHMSQICEYQRPHYFLPHHGVLREQSTTTKLRVVFDGSATTTTNKSLNDIQLIGRPLQNDIFSILLRFRQYKYVACADIEKMYRQILIHDDQRSLQLILWRENTSDEIGVYQLNTVTYGTSSAPFLSMRCLRHLAHETDDKVVARVINEDLFVDDLITGADDPNILANICERTSQVLQSACFPLRKWTFNHDVNVKTLKELAIGEHCQNKTLGLGWKVNSDELHFTTSVENRSRVTKRIMMSIISQIYDPLGILAPTIILAKIMLQKLWLAKIDWDDSVPHNIECTWNRFIQSLSNLANIRIPRYVMSECTQQCELHIFTDASQDAYGACAYIRTYNSCDLQVTTKLLCAKSKVAPVKTICTIPRLELSGALLGARLYHKINNSLRLTFTKVYFWTDSSIVMGWIRTPPHNLKTFVQNRVSQINELTGDAPWYHVPGTDNPADILSRGLALDELNNNSKWWCGPTFLKDRELILSHQLNLNHHELPELKYKNVSLVCNNNFKNQLIEFNRFSSFNRLRRAVAYVLRFVNNVRASKLQRKTGSLSTDELSASVTLVARLAQLESFIDEYYQLTKQLNTKSKRIIDLNVFLDENKVIRVGGRLKNSPHFCFNKKHPVLLCSKHSFTVLLFRYEHKQLLHSGPQALLTSVREAWWPLGGRNLARKTVHECVTCNRFKGRTVQPIMGNLPAERLEPGFPFMRCGVDYAGPVMILNRRDCLHLQLYRDPKDRYKKGQTKASLSLQQFLGFESGFTLDKESNTIAIICQDVTVVLAFETRERLIAWQVKVGTQLGSSKEFLVMVGGGSRRLAAGPARLHLQGRRFALTSGVPPRLLGLWELAHLRRYGVVEGRFCFEGGSHCGKGEGLHLLITDQAQEITDAFDMAARGNHPLQRTSTSRKSDKGKNTRPSTRMSDFNTADSSMADNASALYEENFFSEDCVGGSYWSSNERRGYDEHDFGTIEHDKCAKPPWSGADHVTLERCNNCLTKLGASSQSSTVALTPGSHFNPAWTMESVPETGSDNSSNSTEYLTPRAIRKTFEGCQCINKPPDRPPKPAHWDYKKPPMPLPLQGCACVNDNYPINNPKVGPYENYDVPKTAHSEVDITEYYDTPKRLKQALQEDLFKVTKSSAPGNLVLKKNCGCILKFGSRKKPVIVECDENIQPVECPCQKVTNWANNLISLPYCKRTANENLNTEILTHQISDDMAIYATVDVSRKTNRQSAVTDKDSSNENQQFIYQNIELKDDKEFEGPYANYENLEFALSLEYYENAKDLLKKAGVTQSELDALSANLDIAAPSLPKKPRHCTKCNHSQSTQNNIQNTNVTKNDEYLLMEPSKDKKQEISTKTLCPNPGYTPMSPNPNWSHSLKHPMHKIHRVEIEKSLSIPTLNGSESNQHYMATNNNKDILQKRSSSVDSARLLEDLKEFDSSIGSHATSSSLETLRNLALENRRSSTSCDNERDCYDCCKSSGSENKTSESLSKEVPHLRNKHMDNAQIKRSSSVPCKSGGNRDSSSSNDSGVSSCSLKHGGSDYNDFEMPLTSGQSKYHYIMHKKMRGSLTGCVHTTLPRKSKSSDPLRDMSMQIHKANVRAKSSSAEAEVPVLPPKQFKGVMDTHSTSSGTSDMSDYIETLSMTSSHSSSDTPTGLRLGRQPTTTLRPRSGKEYHNMDPIITSMYKNGKDLANYTNLP